MEQLDGKQYYTDEDLTRIGNLCGYSPKNDAYLDACIGWNYGTSLEDLEALKTKLTETDMARAYDCATYCRGLPIEIAGQAMEKLNDLRCRHMESGLSPIEAILMRDSAQAEDGFSKSVEALDVQNAGVMEA